MINDEIDISKKASKPWKKIFEVVLIYKKTAILMAIAVLVLALLDLAFPILNQYAINMYFENQEYGGLPIYISIYVGYVILYGIVVYFFLHFAIEMQNNISYELRKQAFYKLQELPFSYFDKTPQGWIMARVTSDSRKLAEILSWGFIDMAWGLLTMLGILIVLMVKNILLSLIILTILPVLLVISIFLRRVILKNYRKVRAINSEITGLYNESFLGNNTIKSLVIENSSRDNFEGKARKYKSAAIRASVFSALFGPIVFILGYVGVGATLYEGGILVLDKVLLVSELYLFIDYTILFFEPIINISMVLGDLQQAQASAERIVSLINHEPEIKDTPLVIQKYGTIFEPKRESFEPLIGDIEFKSVTFKYDEGEEVLKNFNLKIPAGTNVALVGHTGSGKSTIVNLICRFYEPTKGEILIDGKSYKDRSIGWLHENLGYVLQSPQLFSGTILENIRYGNLDASLEDVKRVAHIVHADEFIDKLDEKYDYNIGESGNRLSLGEKQLISFARALIADPKILVLDEATSSIDTKTEYLIQDAINNVLKGRTSFMIAHRLSTVVNADLILVMKDGRIIESGKHEDLLSKKGYYYDLYKTQFIKEVQEKLVG